MVRTLLRDERGQTTMEWMVLSIMIVLSMIIIGLAMGQGVVQIFQALAAKIGQIVQSIGI